jgi:phosphoinositide-3-kinase regulatory subunit 4
MCGIERDKEESPLVEVYDIETSNLVEVYESRAERLSSKSEGDARSGNGEIPTRRELIAELAARQATSQETYPQKPASVLSLLVGHRLASISIPEEEGSLLLSSIDKSGTASIPPGYLIIAGEDRIVRYFDLSRPSDGMIICGSSKEKDVVFKSGTIDGVAVNYTIPKSADKKTGARVSGGSAAEERARLEAVRETLGRQPLRPHYDAICALGTVETGVSSCVISGDRSGVVKVWRVDGGGK